MINDSYLEFTTEQGFNGIAEEISSKFCKKYNREILYIDGNNDKDYIRFYFSPKLDFEEAEKIIEEFRIK